MIKPKTHEEINIMVQGGQKLAKIKKALRKMLTPGITGHDVESEAVRLMKESGGEPSFKTVRGYKWATCINVNDGVVHGIPNSVPFKDGDLVKVDLGLLFKDLHTDTAFTQLLGKSSEKEKFCEVGREALNKAIKEARPGKKISDIAKAIEKVLVGNNYSPSRSLSGHAIGYNLHEEPSVPCFWPQNEPDGEVIPEGATLAIEVIYTLGLPEIVVSQTDGWTIATKDGKIAGYYEDTVAILASGPQVLT